MLELPHYNVYNLSPVAGESLGDFERRHFGFPTESLGPGGKPALSPICAAQGRVDGQQRLLLDRGAEVQRARPRSFEPRPSGAEDHRHRRLLHSVGSVHRIFISCRILLPLLMLLLFCFCFSNVLLPSIQRVKRHRSLDCTIEKFLLSILRFSGYLLFQLFLPFNLLLFLPLFLLLLLRPYRTSTAIANRYSAGASGENSRAKRRSRSLHFPGSATCVLQVRSSIYSFLPTSAFICAFFISLAV